MAANPFWRRISLRGVNLVVYAAIAVIAVVYHAELRWAARELPEYLDGSIGAPVERSLYREARRLIDSGEDLERARAMLEESIAIDPTTEAVFQMARCEWASGNDEAALELFLRYVELDPTELDAYLHAATILEDRGRIERAREVLGRGLDYFAANVERFRPRPDPGVAMKYNEKAIQVYNGYRRSVERLTGEIERLEP